MEKVLTMGAFDALDQQEMLDVDGGAASIGLKCVGSGLMEFSKRVPIINFNRKTGFFVKGAIIYISGCYLQAMGY